MTRIALPAHSSVVTLLLLLLLLSTTTTTQAQTINLDLNDLGDLLGGFAGAANQKKDGSCPSACEDAETNSLVPAPKQRIRPYSNGCSVPPSIRQGLGDYSAFEPCCDLHDTCYMSCGVSKPFCETEFGKCMKSICQKKHKTNPQKRQECNGLADMFMMGTTMFGCGGYTELQKEGCDCLDHEEAEKRVNEYAREFYNTYNQTHSLPDKIVQKYLEHETHISHTNRAKKHGELLYRLYKKYPHSIDIISRDGQSGRPGPVYFDTQPPSRLVEEKEEL